MEFRQLQYFIRVAEAKSYSMAAKALYVTQPTLSWNIRKLEEELGTKLIYQQDNSLRLTAAGEKLHCEGKELLQKQEQLIQEIHEIKHERKRVLKIGLTDLFVMKYMKQIQAFISSQEDIELAIVQNGSHTLQKMLAAEEIDFGLLSFPQYETTIEMAPFNHRHSAYSVSVVVNKNHPLVQEGKKSVRIRDLKGYAVSTLTRDYVLGNFIYERCSREGFYPDVVFTNSSWEVLLQNVSISDNLTLLPSDFSEYGRFSDLVWLPLEEETLSFEVGLAKRKDERLCPTAIQFLSFLQESQYKDLHLAY